MVAITDDRDAALAWRGVKRLGLANERGRMMMPKSVAVHSLNVAGVRKVVEGAIWLVGVPALR